MNRDIIAESFACDGGPHILLPASVASQWHGMGVNNDPLDQATDYSRACSVEPPLGLLAIGDEQALVLAGSPAISAWGHGENGAVNIYIFEAWASEDLDELARTALAEISQFVDTNLRWSIPDNSIILMFAGDSPGKAVYGEVTIRLLEGNYSILYGHYDGVTGEVSILQLRPL